MSGTVTKLRPADAEELLGMVEELGRRVDYLTRVAEQHEGKLTVPNGFRWETTP